MQRTDGSLVALRRRLSPGLPLSQPYAGRRSRRKVKASAHPNSGPIRSYMSRRSSSPLTPGDALSPGPDTGEPRPASSTTPAPVFGQSYCKAVSMPDPSCFSTDDRITERVPPRAPRCQKRQRPRPGSSAIGSVGAGPLRADQPMAPEHAHSMIARWSSGPTYSCTGSVNSFRQISRAPVASGSLRCTIGASSGSSPSGRG